MSSPQALPSSAISQYTVLGPRGAVYPGHPLVIAYLVMKSFKSLEDALTTPPGQQSKNLYSLGALPGSVGAIEAAVQVLRLGQSGSFGKALDFADNEWLQSVKGEFGNELWTSGHVQADSLKAAFMEEAPAWCKTRIDS
jgi:hypothetical protein